MKRLTTYIVLAAAIGCIWLAGSRHAGLTTMRDQYNLNQAEPLENTPPLVAFTTVALGGFRGLLVDALWMRLSRLQSEGKYFELVQLADWITKLEPRSSAIWSFQAWNLSYNISVMMASPEDRWRWVYHGVELLRDEGLKYNKGSAKLYKELGWLFQHKIGSDSDHAHWYYKRQWYKRMDSLLQGPRPDYAAMSAVPRDREELLKDESVAALVKRLRAEEIEPFKWSWADPAKRSGRMAEILDSDPEAAETYLLFLRRDALRREYKLSLERMRAIEKDYGPLDWRIPESQSIYWAVKGLPYAQKDFDRDSLNRMVFQSLVALFQHGNYVIQGEELVDLPALELFPYVDSAFQKAFETGSRRKSVDEAYHNFLMDALSLKLYYQREDEARKIFERLKELNPQKLGGQSFKKLEAALREEPADRISRHRAIAKIHGLLTRASKLRLEEKESEAKPLVRRARKTWKGFMSVRESRNFRLRTGLPSFEALENAAQEKVEAE